MKRIIITAILAAICTVGGATSFVMNDLPSYNAWKQDNAQQFRKTPKHDGIDQEKGKHLNSDKDHKIVKDHKEQKDKKDYKDHRDDKEHRDVRDHRDNGGHRNHDNEMNNMSNGATQLQGQMPRTGSVPVSEQPAQQSTQIDNGVTQASNIQSSADQSGQ